MLQNSIYVEVSAPAAVPVESTKQAEPKVIVADKLGASDWRDGEAEHMMDTRVPRDGPAGHRGGRAEAREFNLQDCTNAN